MVYYRCFFFPCFGVVYSSTCNICFSKKKSQFSLTPFSVKLSLCKSLPTCSLNLLKSASLKSTVLIVLLSPSFPMDHKHCHFVTLISISTFAFSAIYFQICRNLPATLSAGFSLPTHQEIVMSTLLELAEHCLHFTTHKMCP